MLLVSLMVSNTGLVAFAKETETETAKETTAIEAVTNDAVLEPEIAPEETASEKEAATDSAVLEPDNSAEVTVPETEPVDKVSADVTVVDENIAQELGIEENVTSESNSVENIFIETDDDADVEDEEILDEDLGKIIGFRSLGTVTFDYEPTVDDIKAALPNQVTAIFKSEDENTEAAISVQYNDAAIEEIVAQISDTNAKDEELTFILEAQVLTSSDYVSGVAAPTVTIKLVDGGYDLVYQTLSDEGTNVTVEGMLPEEATIEVVSDSENIVEAAAEGIAQAEENYDVDKKTVDTKFIVNNYKITVYDAEGNEYIPTETLLITEKLDEDEVKAIAGNQYTIYDEDGELIEHSFDAELGEITYLADSLDANVTTLGTETDYVYSVNFEIRDADTDVVLFSSESRMLKGSEVTVPEFYSSAYDVASIDWGDVEATVTKDATYTTYVNKNDVNVETGEEDADLVVESYGEKLFVEDTTAIDDENTIIIETEECEVDSTEESTADVTENSLDEQYTDDIVLSDGAVIEIIPDEETSENTEAEDTVSEADAKIEENASDFVTDAIIENKTAIEESV